LSPDVVPSPPHQRHPFSSSSSSVPQIQRDAATVLQPYFTSTGMVIKALEHASKMEHIMDFTRLRCMGSLFSMLHQACRNVALYNNNHSDFPMPNEQLERYMQVQFTTLLTQIIHHLLTFVFLNCFFCKTFSLLYIFLPIFSIVISKTISV